MRSSSSPCRPQTSALAYLRSLNLAGAGHPGAGPAMNMETVLRDLTVRMGWSAYSIWTYERRPARLRCTAAWPGDERDDVWPAGTVLAAGEGIPGRALLEGVCLAEYPEHPGRSGIATAVPVVGRPEAVVAFELPSAPDELPEGLVEVIAETGPGAFAHLLLGARRDEDADPLTARELEVLQWAAEGFTTGDIAKLLAVQHRTVARHFEHIYLKLGVSDRLSAVARGFRQGLLR